MKKSNIEIRYQYIILEKPSLYRYLLLMSLACHSCASNKQASFYLENIATRKWMWSEKFDCQRVNFSVSIENVTCTLNRF